MSHADYLNDQSDWGAEDDFREMQQERFFRQIGEMAHRYKVAERAETGATIECPCCKKLFVKKTYNKKFCSNGRNNSPTNCKDEYWNIVDPKRRKRAKFYKNRNARA